MIKDSSLQHIIETWKTSAQKKMIQEQKHIKSKIISEFKKLSKEELLNQGISEVYCVMLFDKEEAPLSSFASYPALPKSLNFYLLEQLKHFYDEMTLINEDGFNLMTYFEYLLNGHNEEKVFWCSYPQISYDIMEEANTYSFVLIEFNTDQYTKNLNFNKQLHPFIKALNYAWISQYREPSYGNTFRKAAASTNNLLGRIWDHINILSSLKYEGIQNKGSLLFVSDYSPTLLLSLENPVSLHDYRQIRKLLQMSFSGHYLLINTEDMAIGFGTIDDLERCYRIEFLDHLTWKMFYGNKEFLSSTNLLPMLPPIGNSAKKLSKQLDLTFDGLPYNKSLLLEIIQEAKFQRKGTMVVITAKAAEEAERLSTSSIKIKPTQFTKTQIKLVTGIDGALIIDTDGYCHSVGSILDGFTTEKGDSSRGARYNSAVRYLNAQIESHTPCLIAVISEDRYVDILTT